MPREDRLPPDREPRVPRRLPVPPVLVPVLVPELVLVLAREPAATGTTAGARPQTSQ
jgi:hypothetical protein